MKRRIFRIVGIVLAIVFVIVAGLGGLMYAGLHKFNPGPPDANYPKPGGALEAQRQDIDYYGKLMDLDRAFSPEARAEAKKRLNALAASNTVLDRAHMRVALLSITALADNGHTSFSSKAPSRAIILPIRFADLSDGLYVMRVKSENADLLGARIVKIDGQPVEDVLTKLETLRGGLPIWRRNYALFVLPSSEYLYGIGVAPAADRSTWTFETQDGRTLERTFKGSQPPYDEPQPDTMRWLSPEPLKDDTRWAAFAPKVQLPVTLQEPNKTFRRVRLKEQCAMLIQLKSNTDEGEEKIKPFLRATEADLEADKPCSIIVDDRLNGGGDYTNTASLAGKLHDLVQPGGHIYLLTGNDTFSAGITTLVFIKQAAAPGQVTILGQPVGDRMAFWAEGNRGCLPNAPFCFHYATGMHDYQHACNDWDKCFWLNWIYPARTDSLKPDELISMSFADYLAGRDPVFDRALALAAHHA